MARKSQRKRSKMEELVRREWAERRAAWENDKEPIFVSQVNDYSLPLDVDTFFGGRQQILREEFRKDGVHLPWIRRCVEAAFGEALNAHHERDYEWAVPQWERGEKLASAVLDALDRLIGWMGGGDAIGATAGESIDQTVQKIRRAAWLASNISEGREAEQTAESGARSLIEARLFAGVMAEKYATHAQSLKAQNVGEPEKQAFVQCLAEAWFYLTGRVHALGASHFQDFVSAVWQEIGGRDIDPNLDENFDHAIRAASKTMKQRQREGHLPPGYRPGWMW